MARALLHIMEEVGSNNRERVKEWIKDAFHEMSSVIEWETDTALYDVINDIKYYQLPSNYISMTDVYQRYDDEGHRYLRIPYIVDYNWEDIPATDGLGVHTTDSQAILVLNDFVVVEPDSEATNTSPNIGTGLNETRYGYYIENDRIVILVRYYSDWVLHNHQPIRDVWGLPTADDDLGIMIKYRAAPEIPATETDTLNTPRIIDQAVVSYIKKRQAEERGDTRFAKYHESEFYRYLQRDTNNRRPYKPRDLANYPGAIK